MHTTRHHLRRTVAALAAGVAILAAAGSAEAAVNGSIAFQRFGDIFVAGPDGTNVTNLTASNKDFEGEADYSPDGSKIAFVHDRRGSGTSDQDVWVMNADGTGAAQVAEAGDRVEGLTWSGDGTKLLFWTDKDSNEIIAELYSINPDGSGETLLTADGPPIDEGLAQLTAAGNKVAWVDDSTFGNREVVLSRIDVAGVTRITNDPGEDIIPVLSPDASRIAWSSDRDLPAQSDGAEIYIANVDGTAPTRLTSSGATRGNYPFAFSPDGTRIGYDNGGHAQVMNADGTSPLGLTPEKAYDHFAQFSPDGTLALYQHTRPIRGEDPHYTLDTVRLDGTGHKIVAGKDLDPDFMDWQALSVPPAAPGPLEFELVTRPAQKSKGLRTGYVCSNECDVRFVTEGQTGAKRFRTKLAEHGYGNDRGQAQLMTPKARAHTTEKEGEATIVAVARDEFGGKVKDTATVTLNSN